MHQLPMLLNLNVLKQEKSRFWDRDNKMGLKLCWLVTNLCDFLINAQPPSSPGQTGHLPCIVKPRRAINCKNCNFLSHSKMWQTNGNIFPVWRSLSLQIENTRFLSFLLEKNVWTIEHSFLVIEITLHKDYTSSSIFYHHWRFCLLQQLSSGSLPP